MSHIKNNMELDDRPGLVANIWKGKTQSQVVHHLISFENRISVTSMSDEDFSDTDDAVLAPSPAQCSKDVEQVVLRRQLVELEELRCSQVSELHQHVMLLKSVLAATSTHKEQLRIQQEQSQDKESQYLKEICALRAQVQSGEERRSAQVNNLCEHVLFLKGILSATSNAKEEAKHKAVACEQEIKLLNSSKSSSRVEDEDTKLERHHTTQLVALSEHVKFLKGILSATSSAKENEKLKSAAQEEKIKHMASILKVLEEKMGKTDFICTNPTIERSVDTNFASETTQGTKPLEEDGSNIETVVEQVCNTSASFVPNNYSMSCPKSIDDQLLQGREDNLITQDEIKEVL